VPQLIPFRALRYRLPPLGDLGAVLCPPYDVISPDERQALTAQPLNAVQVELPGPDDPERYAQAARLFAEWQAAGLLRLDEHPAVYVYEQLYRVPAAAGGRGGERRSARGFFCRLELEEPGAGVLRHERTLSAPKQDRFELLSAVRANLSPVLMLYRSPGRGVESRRLLDALTTGDPIAEASAGGVEHRLWAADPARSPAAAALIELASRGPLAIADGHHRYETALRFRDEVGAVGAEHVLVLLYDADSGGLSVLPTHRLLADVAELEPFIAGLEELFELDRSAGEGSLEARLAAAPPGTLGLSTRRAEMLLHARRSALEEVLPAGSDALRGLDVVVLAAALERVLGVPAGALADEQRLTYTKDVGDARARVAAGLADAAFLLKPTPVAAVLEVAAAGELMPPKSTYFVPKAATGLVFNLLAA
jgi:uncharacterized protein (DUF1015 family)